MRIPVSDQLHLRVLEEADAEEVHRLLESNRSHLSPWMPWARDQDLDRTRNFVRASHERYERNDGFEAALVVGDRIVGCAGFPGVDWVARATSVGYWLAEDQQGRGLMTLAVKALIDHAF